MIDSESELDQIRYLAGQFRAAMEVADLAILDADVGKFPYGWCGDATLLLGTFLTEQGLRPFSYMLGYFTTTTPHDIPQSHAWLQRDRLVVDITADQFPQLPAVIVADPSAWHCELNDCKTLYVADYRNFDDRTVRRLASIYHRIISTMA